jgi:hypothetical protein
MHPNPDGRLSNWALPLSRCLSRQSDRSQNYKGLESLSFHDLMACPEGANKFDFLSRHNTECKKSFLMQCQLIIASQGAAESRNNIFLCKQGTEWEICVDRVPDSSYS